MRFALVLAALLAAPTVLGQPTLPRDQRAAETLESTSVDVDVRSSGATLTPAGAVLLSVGTTAGTVGLGYFLDQRPGLRGTGAALIAVGLLLGPSTGNVVLGNYRDVLIGGGLRLGGTGLAFGAVASTFMNESASDTFVTVAGGAFVVGGVVLLAGTVYDVISAGTYASRVSIAPSVDGPTRATVGVLQVRL